MLVQFGHNINNGAMETFVDVLDNHGEEYDQERLNM